MTAPLPDSALDQLFRSARSYNGYLDKPVSEAQIHAIWEVMKYGPTSANMMPARLVWCTSPEAKEKLAATASSTNGDKIRNAPVSVIIGMDMAFHEQLPWLFPHTDARSWFTSNEALREISAMRNSTLQGAYFIIAARALGLDTGPMSGFDNAAVDAAFFGDTPNVKSNFISTLGYGDPATIFDRLPRPDFDTFNTFA
ncbi:putative NADH dehydrogenase/NAD(P)H nitroreductase [Caenibius tardaugens NBRC 16725]|uniref:Putative NADH dehydrogenase/NAD(P)H nitroreductase n=1 Tax=Caenibius tardaugens NBRC 16725 TaxID=1219035 RepID=U2YNE7_9SPHN|nr:malonic semialdehyde reductase [Caenibius tardaugens]AZI35623.1 malonic semialdehyde reductase [Caenibius tardaugens NBRC 16725]GAD50092.1 putative NADH dehydrogenase/NAD(P)H nitroreductase [Caenibius tardaugens NBRC 16725]